MSPVIKGAKVAEAPIWRPPPLTPAPNPIPRRRRYRLANPIPLLLALWIIQALIDGLWR